MSNENIIVDDYAPGEKQEYNQRLRGLFGEFGAGSDTKVCYLQTGIKSADLDKITLVGDLPGSEKWPVQDLFQREVDGLRVEHKIIPYIEDTDRVKFFPPLTLTILPVHDDGAKLLTQLAHVPEREITLDGRTWVSYEIPGRYRFRFIKGQPFNGLVEWSDSRVKVVAIDGQHRLSALKRIVRRPGGDADRIGLLEWTIPVVIFGLRGLMPHVKGKILNHIRNIFVVINTTARPPNRARTILLSEDSINSICTQEILQTSHENDIKEPSHRDQSKVPLLFYDWRGEEDSGKPVRSPCSIKTSEEIEDLLTKYVTGPDLKQQQKDALGVTPTDALQQVFQKEKLQPKQSDAVREVFKKDLLPALAHLISHFTPYEEYIKFLRDLEEKYADLSESAKYAFYKLRFGVHGITDPKAAEAIADVYDDVVNETTKAKDRLPDLIAREIGFRGIISAFGKLRLYYKLDKDSSATWLAYSKWFTTLLNILYADHWFDGNDVKKEQLLLHITHNERGDVVNYRFDDVDNALGVFVAFLIAHYGKVQKKTRDKLWNTFSESFNSALFSGYRKQCFAEVSEKHPEWTRKQKNEAASKLAEPRADKHFAKIEELLGGNAAISPEATSKGKRKRKNK
jgi:hypothetical protein